MDITPEHIAIAATHPVALKNWYQRVLGADVIFENGQEPPTYLIALKNLWLEIYATEAPRPDHGNHPLAGFRHFALRVDSIEAAKAELEKRGVIFDEEIRPAAGGGRVLFFKDGEGNRLHLVERLESFSLDR